MALPLLQSLLAALRSFAANVPARPSPDVLDRFCDGLASLAPAALDRIAPFDLAEALDLPRGVVVDLCLIAARVGMLELSYHLFCLGCGAAEFRFGELDRVASGSYFCTVCRRERPADLDDRVEVVFRPGVALGAARPDPYASLDAYQARFFSPHFRFADPVAAAVAAGARDFFAVEPGQVVTRILELKPGQAIQALSLDAHLVAHVEARGLAQAVDSDVSIELLPEGLTEPEQFAPPGRVSLHLCNRSGQKAGFILRCLDWAHVGALYRQHPPTVRAFLSARDLLAHQRFAELFGATARVPDFRLQIRNLTVLFTDLKGSTSFYAEHGDFAAWYVIREHFTLLTEVVRGHNGAVVKTMGDAVMAVFTCPRDGVAAALAMHAIWRQKAAAGLPGLKIGVHEGAAVVVNAEDRYDYFGQTVNLAAAVQRLADSGELWLTAPVFESADVSAMLSTRGCHVDPQHALLKGQHTPYPVYRIHAA